MLVQLLLIMYEPFVIPDWLFSFPKSQSEMITKIFASSSLTECKGILIHVFNSFAWLNKVGKQKKTMDYPRMEHLSS